MLLLPLAVKGQISAPGSNTSTETSYPATLRHDPVFIFCSSTAADRGSLTATTTRGTAPYSFSWLRYDSGLKTFSIPVGTGNGTSSTISSLTEGGYSVHITDGLGFDTTMYAWLWLDRPVAGASLKNYTCEMVALDGTVEPDPFVYYDPSTGASRTITPSMTFLWSSLPVSAIPNPALEKDPVTFDPPLVDVEYMLQVTDAYGCSNTASFDYTSIHVKADFTADPLQGEAPLDVSFIDRCVRADSYLWDFGDDSTSILAIPGDHTYYTPGEYTVTLTIESELYCTDALSLKITVDPSQLVIPNVFSPNDDGVNDFFMPEKKSLRFINVQIFAKSGHRVYYYEGRNEDLQSWTGWDGHINYTERKAEPGAYFFVIRAVGFDDIEYKGREYRGTLYLFR